MHEMRSSEHQDTLAPESSMESLSVTEGHGKELAAYFLDEILAAVVSSLLSAEQDACEVTAPIMQTASDMKSIALSTSRHHEESLTEHRENDFSCEIKEQSERVDLLLKENRLTLKQDNSFTTETDRDLQIKENNSKRKRQNEDSNGYMDSIERTTHKRIKLCSDESSLGRKRKEILIPHDAETKFDNDNDAYTIPAKRKRIDDKHYNRNKQIEEVRSDLKTNLSPISEKGSLIQEECGEQKHEILLDQEVPALPQMIDKASKCMNTDTEDTESTQLSNEDVNLEELESAVNNNIVLEDSSEDIEDDCVIARECKHAIDSVVDCVVEGEEINRMNQQKVPDILNLEEKVSPLSLPDGCQSELINPTSDESSFVLDAGCMQAVPSVDVEEVSNISNNSNDDKDSYDGISSLDFSLKSSDTCPNIKSPEKNTSITIKSDCKKDDTSSPDFNERSQCHSLDLDSSQTDTPILINSENSKGGVSSEDFVERSPCNSQNLDFSKTEVYGTPTLTDEISSIASQKGKNIMQTIADGDVKTDEDEGLINDQLLLPVVVEPENCHTLFKTESVGESTAWKRVTTDGSLFVPASNVDVKSITSSQDMPSVGELNELPSKPSSWETPVLQKMSIEADLKTFDLHFEDADSLYPFGTEPEKDVGSPTLNSCCLESEEDDTKTLEDMVLQDFEMKYLIPEKLDTPSPLPSQEQKQTDTYIDFKSQPSSSGMPQFATEGDAVTTIDITSKCSEKHFVPGSLGLHNMISARQESGDAITAACHHELRMNDEKSGSEAIDGVVLPSSDQTVPSLQPPETTLEAAKTVPMHEENMEKDCGSKSPEQASATPAIPDHLLCRGQPLPGAFSWSHPLQRQQRTFTPVLDGYEDQPLLHKGSTPTDQNRPLTPVRPLPQCHRQGRRVGLSRRQLVYPLHARAVCKK